MLVLKTHMPNVGTSDTDLYIANGVAQLSAVVLVLCSKYRYFPNVLTVKKVYDDPNGSPMVLMNGVSVANSSLFDVANLEPNDKLVNANSTNCEAFASVLELYPR